MRKTLLVLAVFIFAISGCTKDDDLQSNEFESNQQIEVETQKFITGTDSRTKSSSQDGQVIDFYNDLDWENTTLLEVNHNGYIKHIYLPNAQTSIHLGYMDPTARFDLKKEDGWELVYNWIPTNSADPVRFPGILFYNKYLGKLKFYYYNLQSLNTNGNVMGTINMMGNTTNLFNFSEEVGDPLKTQYAQAVSQSSYESINSSIIGLSPNQWYAFEYEVTCYDPNLNPGDYIAFSGWGVDLTSISLTGMSDGTITGQLIKTMTSSDYNSLISTKKISGAIDDGATSILTKMGTKHVSPMFEDLKEKTSSGLLKTVFGKLSSESTVSGISGLIGGAFGSLLGKPISKLIGKIFPGKKTTTYEKTDVRLKTKLTHSFEGNMTTNKPFTNVEIQLPTYKINDNSFFGKFGLYRFKNRPTIKVQERFVPSRLEDNGEVTIPSYDDMVLYAQHYLSPVGFTDDRYDYTYVQKATLEDISNLIEFNPDLTAVADVEYNARVVRYDGYRFSHLTDVMIENATGGVILKDDGSVDEDQLIVSPDIFNGNYCFFYKHVVASHIIYQTSPFPPTTSSPDLQYKSADTGYRVLLTLRVTPKDGSEPAIINQMIKADLVENQEREPEPVIMTGGDPFGGGF